MPTDAARELTGLLLAYIDGDVVAKKIVLDWLEEHDDPRRAAVAAEEIDWGPVACSITGQKKLAGSSRWGPPRYPAHTNKTLFEIDCARVGADTRPEVRLAVRAARRRWLQELFPELNL